MQMPIEDEFSLVPLDILKEWRDMDKLHAWAKATASLPLDALDASVVDASYPVMIWLFRERAASGDEKATRAIDTWLRWAREIRDRPKQTTEEVSSPGSVAFLPRGVQ